MFKIPGAALAFGAILAATAATLPAHAADPAALSDTEIAHVAYTADNIDIRYAHLALAKSKHPVVREFANSMLHDHTAVNEQALALLAKLGATAEDNFLSQDLNKNADKIVREMSALDGVEFDRAYAQNELVYHQAVIDLVENTFIPNIDHPEVKALFEQGLVLFKAHEAAAAAMVEAVN